MNKFAQGILFALAFTTPQGRDITQKVAKVGVKMGDHYLKNKMGIDIKQIINEVSTDECVVAAEDTEEEKIDA